MMYKTNGILKRLIILAWLAVGPLSRGQSTFYFANYASGVDAPVFDAVGNPLSGTNFVAMLYGGPTWDSLTPATLPDDYMIPMSPQSFLSAPYPAGYFIASGWVGINTVPGGGTAWLQVRAWDARLGSSYEAVMALGVGGYGESTIFERGGGNPNLPAPGAPQPLVGLQSFSLHPEVVPEPRAELLVLLGLPWLFARRWFARQ